MLVVALFLNPATGFHLVPDPAAADHAVAPVCAQHVAVTRLILSHGSDGMAAAGRVVEAFGGFLMGGDGVVDLA